MGEKTKIAWADATVNFWIGCTKVSAACDFCYAEAFAKRTGRAVWGHGEARSLCVGAADLARKLERRAEREGRRIKVFTNSMSDFFDAEVPDLWRDEAVNIISATPLLDWLVLTKRPQVAREYLRRIKVPHHLCDGGCCNYCGDHDGWVPFASYPLPNLWLGTTVENQKMADLRIPILLDAPAAVRFVSYEPALEYVDFRPWLQHLDWIICGGESGPHARPFDLGWARSVRDQCKAAGVSFFMKQLGARPVLHEARMHESSGPGFRMRVASIEIDTTITPRDRAGADPSEWPADLRVQEFPR